MPVHAHGKGLEALQQHEGAQRRERRSEGAHRLHARLGDEAEIAEALVEAHPVIAARGLGHVGIAAVVPGKLAGFDEHPAHGGAVPADILGGRMDDDVGAVLEGPAQVGRGEGVVDHQRHPGLAAHRREGLEVEQVEPRVADDLAVHRAGARRDRGPEGLGVGRIDEHGLDAKPAQAHVELRIAAAVERARGHDFIARAAQGQQRGHLRGHAGRRGERRTPALERRHALLEHRHGGVGDARIDVAEGLQVEQRGGVLGRIEDEGGALVDRHGTGAGDGVRLLAGMEAERFDTVAVIGHGRGAGWSGSGDNKAHTVRRQ